MHRSRSIGQTEKVSDKIVFWLFENRTEGCSKKALENASINGHTEIIAFLEEIVLPTQTCQSPFQNSGCQDQNDSESSESDEDV